MFNLKVKKLSLKYKKTLVLLLIVTIVISLFWVFLIRDKANILTDSEKNELSLVAAGYAENGDFTQAIAVRLELFDKEQDQTLRAELANHISNEYYALKDSSKGREWADVAIDLYKESGKEEQAKEVEVSANEEEALIDYLKTAPIEPAGGSNNALE